MSRVLVTGSAGAVGRSACAALVARGHAVRGFDRVPTPDVQDFVVRDVADADRVRGAVAGCDTVVHLAAQRDDAPFLEALLSPNVVGLFQVMSAAHEAGVSRVVLASSVQVVGRTRDGEVHPFPVTAASPANHYALTKLWAETLGAMYARTYGMSVIAVRLGWMVRDAREAGAMERLQRHDLYLSRADAGRFFVRAVEAPTVTFAVVYAVSAEGVRCFDMEPARRLLGFEPLDRWPEGLGFPVPAEAPG
jgi:nucleoside-diphosphate-sugar epimerase